MAADMFLIWSIEHGGWWATQERGYTQELHRAGVYPAPRAREIVERANVVRVNECLVPLEAVTSIADIRLAEALVGRPVRWNHQPKGQPFMVLAADDGMVEVEGFTGRFSPTGFVLADIP